MIVVYDLVAAVGALIVPAREYDEIVPKAEGETIRQKRTQKSKRLEG